MSDSNELVENVRKFQARTRAQTLYQAAVTLENLHREPEIVAKLIEIADEINP